MYMDIQRIRDYVVYRRDLKYDTHYMSMRKRSYMDRKLIKTFRGFPMEIDQELKGKNYYLMVSPELFERANKKKDRWLDVHSL